MIPGFDFRGFGHDAQARARAVFAHQTAIARRYAQLALEATKRGRVGLAARYVARGIKGGRQEHLTPARRASIRTPDQPGGRTGAMMPFEAGLRRERRQLAELFKLAEGRGQVEWCAARLQEGWKPKLITLALRSMPEVPPQARSGFARRIADRDALAAAAATAEQNSGTPSDPVAALKAAYAKATGEQI